MQTSGGHLSPGASGLGSIGTMHLGSAADLLMGSSTTLDIDIASPDSYDTIAWDGGSRTLALAGTLNIFNDSGNATIPDGAYTLISGFSTYSGLSNLNFGAVPVGHIFSLAVTPVGNRFNLVLTAAPEPGTVVLLATGLLSLLAYTWKKRK
jgi:hypothetical protein